MATGLRASLLRLALGASALAVCGMLAGLACGGTTGREGLPTPQAADGGQDATLAPDGGIQDLDAGAFDVTIVYADRLLPDVQIPDAGADGADAMPDGGLGPCTSKNPIHCVQCQGNISGDGGNEAGLCTPTEANFVQHDIDLQIATDAGPDPNGGCYSCLFSESCIDDTEYGDNGHECEDGTFVIVGNTTVADCETAIQCILGSSCATGGVAGCYCGDAGLETTCQGNPAVGPINGACAQQIATGLGFQLTDGTDVTNNFTSLGLAAGRAIQLFVCAAVDNCTACFQ
jgi:hypothetical protein